MRFRMFMITILIMKNSLSILFLIRKHNTSRFFVFLPNIEFALLNICPLFSFSSISLFSLISFWFFFPFLISRFILFSLFFLQWGSSALMKASVNGHLEVVRLLLDRGANIDVVNNVNYIFIF